MSDPEEVKGLVDIEKYLYRADPYRSTDARQMWSLPLRREHIDEATVDRILLVRLKEADKLRKKISLILNDFDIIHGNDFGLCSCTKPEYPGGDKAQMIMFIPFTYPKSEFMNRGFHARIAIVSVLLNYGLHEIRVEVSMIIGRSAAI